jgi:hypothetical protein
MAGVGETAISTTMPPGSGMNFFGATFTAKATGQFAALYAAETLAGNPQISPESQTEGGGASQLSSGNGASGVIRKMQPPNTKNSSSSLTNLELVTPQMTMPTPTTQLTEEPIAASLSAETEDVDRLPEVKSTAASSSGAEFSPTLATNIASTKAPSVPGPTSSTYPASTSRDVLVHRPSVIPNNSEANGTASMPAQLSMKPSISSAQSGSSPVSLSSTQVGADLTAHDTAAVDQKSSAAKNPLSDSSAAASVRSVPQSKDFDVPPAQSTATATSVSDSGNMSFTDPSQSVSFMQVIRDTSNHTESNPKLQTAQVTTNAVTENALSPQNGLTSFDASVSYERNVTNFVNQSQGNEPPSPGVVSRTILQAGIPQNITPQDVVVKDSALAKGIQQGAAPQVEVLIQNSPRDPQPIDDSQAAVSTQTANEVPASEAHVQNASPDSPGDLPLSGDNNGRPTSQPSSPASHSAPPQPAENLLASIRTLLANGTAQDSAQPLPNLSPTTTGVPDISSSVLPDRLSFAVLAVPPIANSIQIDTGASGVNSISKNEIHRAASTDNAASPNPAAQPQTAPAGQDARPSTSNAGAASDSPTVSPQKSIATAPLNSVQAIGASHTITNAQPDPATLPAGTATGPTQPVPSSVSSIPSSVTSKTDGGHTNAPAEASPNLPVLEPQPAPASDAVQMAQMVNRASQSEMRIGLNTSAFGSVEVRATVHANDIGVSIGSEKGDLRSLIANDLPSIANTLQQQNLRLNQVNFHQGFAFSNHMSSGGDAQQRWAGSRTPASRISVEEAASENSEIQEVTSTGSTAGLSILA